MKKTILFSGLFIGIVLLVGFASGTLSVDTFQPGDVSGFTVYSDDDTHYIEIPEDDYTSDFEVLTADVNINAGLLNNLNIALNDLDLDYLEGYMRKEYEGDESSLRALYHLNESSCTSGSCVIDSSSNNYHGVPIALENEDWVTGLIGNSYNQDGLITEYIQLPAATLDGLEDFTIDFWVNIDNIHTGIDSELNGFISGCGGTSDVFTFGIWGDINMPSDNFYLKIFNTQISLSYSAGINESSWYHIAGRRDGTNFTLFVDGVEVDSGTVSSTPLDISDVVIGQESDTTGTCGSFNPDQSLEGRIEELRITAEALTKLQIMENLVGAINHTVDFSTQLTTAMNSCSGNPCELYFDITGDDWGNVTLDGLNIEINTAPSTPTTLSPDNDSIFFNDPTLTCSGSIDLDEDDINYLFWNFHSVILNQSASWNGDEGNTGDTDFYEGSSINDRFYVRLRDDGEWIWYSSNFSINADSFILNVQLSTYGANTFDGSIRVDGITVWTMPSDYSQQNITIDLSDYNDGEEHSIGFVAVMSGSPHDNDWNYFYWWFDGLNSNETILQNSSATNYEWEDLASGNYLWSCQACDNQSTCSNFTETRSLYKMDFEECSEGNVALNFTGKDEETGDLLIPDMSFDAALMLESAADSLLYNFGLEDDNNYQLCLIPDGVDVNITGFIEYDSTNSSYSFPRQYYFQDAIINGDTTNNINLFQLSDEFATPITFTAIRGAYAVEDILIHVQRYDPGTGVYTLVAMGETGATGQDIIYMRMTDAWYRILAYEDGVLVYTGDPEHILDSTYTISLAPSGDGMGSYWDDWEALDSINYNLAFNSSGTNMFTLTADDGTGASSSMCLKVEKWSMLDGMETLYYECEESASITMSYEVTDLDATYIGKFIANFDGGWRLMDTEEVSLKTSLSDLIGIDGIIYAILLVGIIAFVGLSSPVAAIVLTIFGLIVSFLIGLISIEWGALIGLIAVGGIILAKMRT